MLPVIELITQNVVDTLAGVRVASGYHVDLIAERRVRSGNRERDGLAVVLQGDPEKVDDAPEGRVAWRQRYAVVCYVVESETSTRPIDQRINLTRSDVEKALMVDFTRGGNAYDTVIQEPELFDDPEGRWDGVVVYFDVLYRTTHDDPYERG